MKTYLFKSLILFLFITAFSLPVLAQRPLTDAGLKGGRKIVTLNKDWQFYKGNIPKGEKPASLSWREVNIPHSWNKIDMQMDTTWYMGNAWYEKSIIIPKSDEGKRLFLRFNAVGNVADVYINGRFIGEHRGGYSAFCYEITDVVHFGKKNVIKVKVNNKTRPDVTPINNRLFANYGGIYRPVHLIITNKLNITLLDYASLGIYISQHNVSGRSADISVKVKLANQYRKAKEVDVKAILEKGNGAFVQASSIKTRVSPQGITVMKIPLYVKHPHLWDGRKDPYLYSVHVEVKRGNKLFDEVTQPLGIRSFHIKPGHGFYLNGKPYRLYGVSVASDWKGHGNALTDSMQRVDMDMVYDIGARSVRLGHYQQEDIVYSLCDSLGILAWTEIPYVNAWSGKEGPNAKQQLTELIKQNYNHPSIFVWGLHNEIYAKHPTDYPVRLTRQLNDLAKRLDPGRLTASVDGYGNVERPMNNMADIQGINRYYGWYVEKMSGLKGWLKGIKKNYPKYNIALTEYGAGANIKNQSEVAKKPHNIISGDFFSEQYQTKLHVHEWADIQKYHNLVASYVWVMFDFFVPGYHRGGRIDINMKGLVTANRKIEKDAYFWYKANWSKEPVLHITDRRLKVRTKRNQRIEVFSNLSDLKLYVNGRQVFGIKKGVNNKDFVWPSVQLRRGKNVLKVTASKNGKQYSDEIKTIYKE